MSIGQLTLFRNILEGGKSKFCVREILWIALVVGSVALQGCHLGRATRSDPSYLRSHHAGSMRFSSERPVKVIFDRIAADARKCYVGGAVDMIQSAGPGIFVAASSPGRQVDAVFDEAQHSGVVRGFVDGNIYLPIFQIDISKDGHGSQLDVYYDQDVSMQKAVPENVKAWLVGDDAACSFKFSQVR